MRTTRHELATSSILNLTLRLLQYGRPRKLPGKPRPRAVFTNGGFGVEPCNPRADYGEQFSLDGALTHAAYFYRRDVTPATLSRARKAATLEILLALQHYGSYYGSLAEADNAIEDTRKIVRAVKRADKQWRVHA